MKILLIKANPISFRTVSDKLNAKILELDCYCKMEYWIGE